MKLNEFFTSVQAALPARRGNLYEREGADGQPRRYGPYYVWTRCEGGKMVSERVTQEDAPRVRDEIARGKVLDRLIGQLWKVAEDLARNAGDIKKKRSRRTARGAPAGDLCGRGGRDVRPAGRRNQDSGRHARFCCEYGGHGPVRPAAARGGSGRAAQAPRAAHDGHPLGRRRGPLYALVHREREGRAGLSGGRRPRTGLRLHTRSGEAAVPYGSEEPVLRGGVRVAGLAFRHLGFVKHHPAAGGCRRSGHGGLGAGARAGHRTPRAGRCLSVRRFPRQPGSAWRSSWPVDW